MGFYVSPGVYVREKDLSEIIPNLSTSTAAIVGYSRKGSITAIQLMTNSQQFIQEYGTPTPGEYLHYSALAYLEKGNKLYCLRVANGAKYGGVKIMQVALGPNQSLVVGLSTPAFQTVSSETILFYVFAKDPGVWNNDLGIQVINSDDTEKTFDIVIYQKDADGNYQIVESWTVSRQHKLDGFGRQLYLEDRINGFSSYIVVADSALTNTLMPTEQATTLAVGGGTDGSAITDTHVTNGWDLFANPDDVDIRILVNSGYATTAVQQKMKTIAESRKDCIAILDMPYEQLTSVTSMSNWRRSTQNFNTSYVALYTGWVKVYDQYNDKVIEVPPSGYIAAQMAYNDYVAEPWYAPAGFNRGILNVIGATNVFTQGERDTLYESQINPIQVFRGEGIVIWGQKTEQVKASALDRINVRRLLIVLEKAISASLRYFAFEPNSEITRFRVTATIESYLDLLSARSAFQTELGDKGFKVLCNTTNNTPAIIDRNELHVDIFIKPSRAAEYIQLQAIITQTGASFDELIAKGVMF